MAFLAAWKYVSTRQPYLVVPGWKPASFFFSATLMAFAENTAVFHCPAMHFFSKESI
jgi:hypothetical protein